MHHGATAVVPPVQEHTQLQADTGESVAGSHLRVIDVERKHLEGRESIRKGNKRRIHTRGAHKNNSKHLCTNTGYSWSDYLSTCLILGIAVMLWGGNWVRHWTELFHFWQMPSICFPEPPGDNFMLDNGSIEEEKLDKWSHDWRQKPVGGHSRGAINLMQTFFQSASWAAQIQISHIKMPDDVQNDVWGFSTVNLHHWSRCDS